MVNRIRALLRNGDHATVTIVDVGAKYMKHYGVYMKALGELAPRVAYVAVRPDQSHYD